MTPKYIIQVVVKGSVTCWLSDDDSSKQNWQRERPSLSLPPSLSLQGKIGMGETHSLLAMYVSEERQTCNHDWY